MIAALTVMDVWLWLFIGCPASRGLVKRLLPGLAPIVGFPDRCLSCYGVEVGWYALFLCCGRPWRR